MRRLVLITFLLPLLLNAQTRSGPKAGLALASISSGQLLQWNGIPKLGPIIGWSWEVPWTRQVSFLFEPMYISKGSTVRNAVQDQWTINRMGFAELPVILKLSMDTVQGGFFLSGGIMGSYWLNWRQKVRQSGNTVSDFTYDLSGVTRRARYGIALGMGVDGKHTSFEVRAQTSISPFSRVYQAQNLVIGLHFTYFLPKKKDRKNAAEEDQP